jgi:hypothetical protein
MHWMKDEYLPVLSGLVEQFVATKKDARAAVVSDAARQVKEVAEQHGHDVPELLERVSLLPLLHVMLAHLVIWQEN